MAKRQLTPCATSFGAAQVPIARNYEIIDAPPASATAIRGDEEAWKRKHPNNTNDYPGITALPPDAKVIATFRQPPGKYQGKVLPCT